MIGNVEKNESPIKGRVAEVKNVRLKLNPMEINIAIDTAAEVCASNNSLGTRHSSPKSLYKRTSRERFIWLVSQLPLVIMLLFALPHIIGMFVHAQTDPCRERSPQMIYNSVVISFCYFSFTLTFCIPLGVIVKPPKSFSISVLNIVYAVMISTALLFSSFRAGVVGVSDCAALVPPPPVYSPRVAGTQCSRITNKYTPNLQKQLKDTCGDVPSMMATNRIVSNAYGGVSVSDFLDEWTSTMHLIEIYAGANWKHDDTCPRALNHTACAAIALSPCTNNCLPWMPCTSMCDVVELCHEIDFTNLASDNVAIAALTGFLSPGVGNLVKDALKIIGAGCELQDFAAYWGYNVHADGNNTSFVCNDGAPDITDGPCSQNAVVAAFDAHAEKARVWEANRIALIQRERLRRQNVISSMAILYTVMYSMIILVFGILARSGRHEQEILDIVAYVRSWMHAAPYQAKYGLAILAMNALSILYVVLTVQHENPPGQNPVILMTLVLVALYPIFSFTRFVFAHPQLNNLKLYITTTRHGDSVGNNIVARTDVPASAKAPPALKKKSMSWAPSTLRSKASLSSEDDNTESFEAAKVLSKFVKRASERLSSAAGRPNAVKSVIRRTSTEIRFAYRKFDSVFGYKGSHFFLRAVLVEIIEIPLQIASLFHYISKLDYAFVLAFSVLISLNLIVMPLLIYLRKRRSLVLCEGMFDIAWIVINSTVLIGDTSTVTVMSGVTMLSIAVPSICASELTTHLIRANIKSHSSSSSSSARSSRERNQHHSFMWFERLAAIFFSALGVFLLFISSIAVVRNQRMCTSIYGDCVWERISPKIYFRSPKDILTSGVCDVRLVESLDVSFCGLSIIDDFSLANLTSLHTIDLRGNALVSLPRGVLRLASHEKLKVVKADIFPKSDVNWSHMGLTDENIPLHLLSLYANIQAFDISGNTITNALPIIEALSSSERAYELQFLNFEDNNVKFWPNEATRIPSLLHVGLAGNAFAHITPSFFEWLGASSLRSTSLDRNPIVNLAWPPPLLHLPHSLWSFNQLEVLTLCCSREIEGTIPKQIARLTSLEYAIFRRSGIRGTIPAELFGISTLVSIDLEGMQSLHGTLPTMAALTRLQLLDTSNTPLSGAIPSTVAALISLEKFDVSGSSLEGSLDALVRLTNLRTIDVHDTQFTGTIPSAIARLSELRVLRIHRSGIEGSIPTTLGSLRQLTSIDFASTKVTGSINLFFGLRKLKKLWLPMNVTGTLPSNVSSIWPNIVEIVMQKGINGTFPRYWSGCTRMEVLRLIETRLEGAVPRNILELGRLKYLSLPCTVALDSHIREMLENRGVSVTRGSGRQCE